MGNNDTRDHRAREAAHLQLIEGKTFDAEDIAMFEMFDSEGFSTEQRIAYIYEDLKRRMREKEAAHILASNATRVPG